MPESQTPSRASHAPTLGDEGEPCAGCGTKLAADQRYCLNCGRRRAEARLPFMEILAGAAEPAEPPPDERRRSLLSREPTAVLGVAALALFGLALGIGVLIGRPSEVKQAAAAPAPAPVINVNGGGGGTGGSDTAKVSDKQLKDDWPEGKDGYTVQLKKLDKGSSQPADADAAKSEATSNGAKDVGALDSDNYPSLDGGAYVVYSGVYDKKAEAKKSLKKLGKDFPDARVIHVASKSKGETDSGGKGRETLSRKKLKELDNLSPEEYQRRSRKLPDELDIPGKPPPKDGKKPGAGSKTEAIG